MTTTISSGFLGGLFATFGVILAILILVGVSFLRKSYVGARRGRKDLPNIMLEYRKTLLKRDMFEEYVFITKFLKQLKKNEVPKELADRYILDVDCNLSWFTDNDGAERLGFKYSYTLIPRVPFIKKKENLEDGAKKPDSKENTDKK